MKTLYNPRHSLNITSSFFHFTKLKHLKLPPYYRVSTPKVPIYFLEAASDSADHHDDKYVIPIENYRTMNSDHYKDLLRLEYDLLTSQVFLVDESTSLLYEVLEDASSSSSMANVLVLLDMFDDIAKVKALF